MFEKYELPALHQRVVLLGFPLIRERGRRFWKTTYHSSFVTSQEDENFCQPGVSDHQTLKILSYCIERRDFPLHPLFERVYDGVNHMSLPLCSLGDDLEP